MQEQHTEGNKMKGSCFKRACKAIKGTFSRPKKTKVVPFEPDPSDLQPDPIVQPHLCVFEPVLLQDPAVDLFPASCNFEQTTLEDLDDPQPGPSGLHSAAPEEPADHQPEQQTAKDKKTKGSRAGFKRACKAIKGTFSRHKKTKVVPFEPDPSDLQPDPIVQTHLCVFEPVLLQDPAVDLFPASCNFEQTILEDLDDPQPGPSGLHSAAPEEPADHQPEQQTAKDKKTKGSRAGFKRACKAIKGKFSRHKKTKVVPFEPDPSDLQPDPIVQTHLCVFEPVVVQDPAVDLFPASCHFEQTTHEDLDDPQPGPSGIQSAVPEEPVDHQPEQQTKEPTDPDPSDLQAGPPVLEPTVLEEPAEIQPERSVSLLYEEGRILGIGYSGVVYEGIRKSDGQKVAIKKLIGTNDFRLNVPGYSKPLFKEAAIHLQLHKREKCPNIVQMLDWFEEEERCTIVLEYPHPCLTLWHFLQRYYVSETLARHFIRQVVIAAQHWLDHGVNHGDLSLKNVLINTETKQLKVIDFGCSLLISTINDLTSGYCDQAYAAADTVKGMGNLLKKIDSWNEIYKLVSREQEYVPFSEECKDLIERSTCSNLADRLSLDEFSDHEWFKQG
ncbi:uncharacterized protein LOC130407191 [Triplophysa dalaica]|uniref:uncharacterized protein LOC130407191 n=1 Tax=Triplophysa dalaica TaxID=1582913 RepID=UPI0024DFDE61|nr:uncharacterized protein LOC130407191 [Triplophysa dalaica]XP_056585893.1 uncharacterized protein LOC130407191 [Triplophysa dalaica]